MTIGTMIGAGLTWALPMRPDLLGSHLDEYMKTLPTLHRLRLCHRFGQGADVHITKLPVEIEQAIEEVIVRQALRGRVVWDFLSTWREQFQCFESRCQPMNHLPDCNSPLSDAVEDVEEREGCEDDHWDSE